MRNTQEDKFIDNRYEVDTDRYLYCKYNIHNEESPTVVFEAGLGDTNDSWYDIQLEISNIASTISYDRAGRGKSDKVQIENPRTCIDMVNDLKQLLALAPVKPPFILVAHSFGGLVIRLFANMYPDLVAGVVLVDSAVEYKELKYEEVLSDEQVKANREYYNNPMLNSEKVDKIKSYSQVSSNNHLYDIPLSVIIRGLPDNYDEELPNDKILNIDQNMQQGLADLSTNSKITIAKKSQHYVHQQQRKLVIEEITNLYNKFF